MKKFAGKECQNMFLEAFFFAFKKTFSEFPYKIFIIVLHNIIALQNFSLCFSQSMRNLHWCYTALSQSDSSNFFMRIIINLTN